MDFDQNYFKHTNFIKHYNLQECYFMELEANHQSLTH